MSEDTPRTPAARLRATYEQFPQLAACEAEVARRTATIAELEAGLSATIMAVASKETRALLEADVQARIAAERAAIADVQLLVSYFQRKRAQEGRFQERAEDAGREAAALRGRRPETEEDRRELQRTRREAVRRELQAVEALELFDAEREGATLRQRIDDFFGAEAAEGSDVQAPAEHVSFSRAQRRKLATVQAGHPLSETLPQKELLTLEEHFEQLVTAQPVSPDVRVFAETVFARALSLPTPEERQHALRVLELALWHMRNGATTTPLPEYLRSILQQGNGNLSSVIQSQRVGRSEIHGHVLKTVRGSTEDDPRGEIEAYLLVEQFRLTTDPRNNAYRLPSLALWRLFRSGALTDALVQAELPKHIQQRKGKPLAPEEEDALRRRVQADVESRFVEHLRINPHGWYPISAEEQYGQPVRALGFDRAQMPEELVRALQEEEQRIAAELVPTLNAQRPAALESRSETPLLQHWTGLRVDTANGNVETTVEGDLAQTLNAAGRVVHSQAAERAGVQRAAREVKEAEYRAKIAAIIGTQRSPEERASTELLLGETPEGWSIADHIRAIEHRLAELLAERGRLTGIGNVHAEQLRRLESQVGQARSASREVERIASELKEFGVFTKTSRSGRSEKEARRLLSESQARLGECLLEGAALVRESIERGCSISPIVGTAVNLSRLEQAAQELSAASGAAHLEETAVYQSFTQLAERQKQLYDAARASLGTLCGGDDSKARKEAQAASFPWPHLTHEPTVAEHLRRY